VDGTVATSSTTEVFSVSHFAILDGTSAATETDLYGVRSANLAADVGNFDNNGDDANLSTWFWLNFATLTVESGYIPMDVAAMLSGTAVATTGTGSNDFHEMPLWTFDSANQGPKPCLIRMPAKDKNGLARYVDFVLYRVQFGVMTFNGPAYKQGMAVSFTARANLSSIDEVGAPVSLINGDRKPRVGRILSRPYDLSIEPA
jgi:hypothetical protein